MGGIGRREEGGRGKGRRRRVIYIFLKKKLGRRGRILEYDDNGGNDG